MILTIYNEQGFLEVEARVRIEPDDERFGGMPVAEVTHVWVEGKSFPLSSLSDHLLDELEQQALEEL